MPSVGTCMLLQWGKPYVCHGIPVHQAERRSLWQKNHMAGVLVPEVKGQGIAALAEALLPRALATSNRVTQGRGFILVRHELLVYKAMRYSYQGTTCSYT